MHTVRAYKSQIKSPLCELRQSYFRRRILCPQTEMYTTTMVLLALEPHKLHFILFNKHAYCLIGDNGRLQYLRFCLLKCMLM